MIPIQEVHIYVGNDSRITGHIIGQDRGSEFDGARSSPAPFTVELLIYSPVVSTEYSTLKTLNQAFPDAVSAFGALTREALDFANTSEQTLVRISNPCNCEFVDEVTQQSIVDSLGIQVQVEGNA